MTPQACMTDILDTQTGQTGLVLEEIGPPKFNEWIWDPDTFEIDPQHETKEKLDSAYRHIGMDFFKGRVVLTGDVKVRVGANIPKEGGFVEAKAVAENEPFFAYENPETGANAWFQINEVKVSDSGNGKAARFSIELVFSKELSRMIEDAEFSVTDLDSQKT